MRAFVHLCPAGLVKGACWIQIVDFVSLKMAPTCTTLPVFLSISHPRIMQPGEGQIFGSFLFLYKGKVYALAHKTLKGPERCSSDFFLGYDC